MPYQSLLVSFADADPSQIDKLGAKGAKLAEDFLHSREIFPGMENSIAVPDGFILTTEVWKAYHANGDQLAESIWERINRELDALGQRTGRKFGDCSGQMPLIVAVRGGAPVSLPGAISTILNVGLNDAVVAALIEGGIDESFALTTYLTAIRMYGEVVLGIHYDEFYEVICRFQAGGEGSLSVPLLEKLIDVYQGILQKHANVRSPAGFEMDLSRQLRNAIQAVLDSWMAPTAVEARRSRQSPNGGIPDDMGTAVTIQYMVFGNRDDQNCLSGVLFTRDQRTGAKFPVIEWAPKVQCDKIVSGKLRKQLRHTLDLKDRFPDIFERLTRVCEGFESHAKRPLDIEFTVDDRKLFILQRRPLRMTFNATVRAMWDFIDEGKTNIQLASLIINKALEQPEKILRDKFHDYQVLARGEPITNSADSGILTFGTEAALQLAEAGEEVILLRKRPYGETDVAVNHPRIRGIIRCDGNATGHEAVSAVAYSKPYLINLVDVEGAPIILFDGDKSTLNPESSVFQYLGKRTFVDGERGILGFTHAQDFLEDRKSRKKLYVDWEYLREQFDAAGYNDYGFEQLLDLHYQWELELSGYQRLEKSLRNCPAAVPSEELLRTFETYLDYLSERDRERCLRLKDVTIEDFDFGPPLVYRGAQLGKEVLKVLRTLMLCTTWRTHWVHEIMVAQARARGETENDVIRDIFIKNRTMSLVHGFEDEGFHVMQVPDYHYLILGSNFEYGQDLDKVQIGPGGLRYAEKESLAKEFIDYLEQVNPELYRKVRMIQGEPPLGQGHARIISIGIAIPNGHFGLVCRYLRTFLDQRQGRHSSKLQEQIPAKGTIELYQLDPFFAPYPDFQISQQAAGPDGGIDYFLIFGGCSFGEYDGIVYGKEDYDRLIQQVKEFESHFKHPREETSVRPWQFEVDPYRRHSVIAGVGIRFNKEEFQEVLAGLKRFLNSNRPGEASGAFPA